MPGYGIPASPLAPHGAESTVEHLFSAPCTRITGSVAALEWQSVVHVPISSASPNVRSSHPRVSALGRSWGQSKAAIPYMIFAAVGSQAKPQFSVGGFPDKIAWAAGRKCGAGPPTWKAAGRDGSR